MTALEIDILHDCNNWLENATIIDESYIKSVVSSSLSLAGFQGDNDMAAPTEISIVLSNDDQIQQLNKTYRSKDKPTNVLSFPQDESTLLGDVIISFDTIAREAQDQDKHIKDHFTHMLVHGCLHLLGFDHIDESEAEEMEALEVKILSQLGIKNPYEIS